MPEKAAAARKNDKEITKQKLISAVGAIIRDEGFKGLGLVNICRKAGVNRRLLKLYFNSVDELVETYIRGKDYWTTPAVSGTEFVPGPQPGDSRAILEKLLQDQLVYFSSEEEMQKIILWQISERSRIMFEVAEEREKLGDEFFKLAEPAFENTSVDLRAVAGLLVGGIYYMILHAKTNDSLFCGIDLNTSEGLERVKTAISEILKDTYQRAEQQRKQ